jgi:hypothetical protein
MYFMKAIQDPGIVVGGVSQVQMDLRISLKKISY